MLRKLVINVSDGLSRVIYVPLKPGCWQTFVTSRTINQICIYVCIYIASNIRSRRCCDLSIQDNALNRSLLGARDKREYDVGASGNAFAEDSNDILESLESSESHI